MGTRNRSATAVATMVVAVLALVAGVPRGAEGAGPVSCGDVVRALVPCSAFLTGAGAAVPTVSCCQGALALRRMAATADARRAMCRCVQQSGPSFGVVPERARLLPARCNLALNVPIGGGTTDCNKIS